MELTTLRFRGREGGGGREANGMDDSAAVVTMDAVISDIAFMSVGSAMV